MRSYAVIRVNDMGLIEEQRPLRGCRALSTPETGFFNNFQMLAQFNDSRGKRDILDRLRLPAAVQVLLHIYQQGETTAPDLANLGFSTSTIYRALGLLGDLGLAEAVGVIRQTDSDRRGKPAALWRLRT